jgi:hypothetical protein
MQVGDKFNMTLARTLNKDGSSLSNVYDKVGHAAVEFVTQQGAAAAR